MFSHFVYFLLRRNPCLPTTRPSSSSALLFLDFYLFGWIWSGSLKLAGNLLARLLKSNRVCVCVCILYPFWIHFHYGIYPILSKNMFNLFRNLVGGIWIHRIKFLQLCMTFETWETYLNMSKRLWTETRQFGAKNLTQKSSWAKLSQAEPSWAKLS